MELRPKIGGSYKSFKTRQPRLSLGVTDFILLRPCGDSFTGYQLRRESSSKCCSWPSRVWTISFLLTCLTFSSSMSQGEKICALGMKIFFVFHVPNVLLVIVHFVLLDRVSGTPSLPIFAFHLQSAFSKKSFKTHLFLSDWLCFLLWYHIVVFFNFYVTLYYVLHLMMLFIMLNSVCNFADFKILLFLLMLSYNVQRCDQFGIALYKCCVIIMIDNYRP